MMCVGTGSTSCRADAGGLQGEGRWYAVCPVHPSDTLTETHGSGGSYTATATRRYLKLIWNYLVPWLSFITSYHKDEFQMVLKRNMSR